MTKISSVLLVFYCFRFFTVQEWIYNLVSNFVRHLSVSLDLKILFLMFIIHQDYNPQENNIT